MAASRTGITGDTEVEDAFKVMTTEHQYFEVQSHLIGLHRSSLWGRGRMSI
jgi:hypothetical protein